MAGPRCARPGRPQVVPTGKIETLPEIPLRRTGVGRTVCEHAVRVAHPVVPASTRVSGCDAVLRRKAETNRPIESSCACQTKKTDYLGRGRPCLRRCGHHPAGWDARNHWVCGGCHAGQASSDFPQCPGDPRSEPTGRCLARGSAGNDYCHWGLRGAIASGGCGEEDGISAWLGHPPARDRGPDGQDRRRKRCCGRSGHLSRGCDRQERHHQHGGQRGP